MNKKTLLTCLLLFLISLLIIYPNLCLKAAQDGLLLWFNKVLPSLLPFMIFINLLVPLDGLKKMITATDRFTKHFWHLPGYSFFAFLMGLLGSYPMGAKTVKTLYKEGKLSRSDAELTLCFSNNCGPLFIIATVGTAMFHSTKLGYFLLFIHILSAVLLSICLTRFYQVTPDHHLLNETWKEAPPFTTILNRGVMNAMETILCVGGYIILFSVLLALLTKTHLLSTLTLLLHLPASYSAWLTALIASLLEISNGSFVLSTLQPTNIFVIALASSCISFGGFCIFFQTLYVLDDCLPTGKYLVSKLIQAFFSFALTLISYPVFLMYTQKTSLCFHWPYLFVAILIFLIGYFLLSMIFTPKHPSSAFLT